VAPGVSKGLKRTLITLIVLVIVLVAADYGAAAAAEYQVSKKMRAQLNLSDDPSVDIHGFPFITQALAGDYSDISVNATGIPVKNTMRDLEIDADLHDVRVGLGDLLSGNARSVSIDEVDGQVQIKASDLGRLLGIPDLAISPQSLDTVQGAGSDQAQQDQMQQSGATLTGKAGLSLDGTVDIAGQQTKVTVFGLISVSGGGITVKPTSLQVSNDLISGPIPQAVQQLVLGHFAYTFKPSDLPLPFTVQPTGVQVQDGALVVQGVAHNVTLSASDMS
jgi:hypothetical protein